MIDTLTLSRDGHTATVRVGDVVLMTDGSALRVMRISKVLGDTVVALGMWPGVQFFGLNGRHVRASDCPSIDIAALTRPAAPGDGLAGAWLPIESAPRDGTCIIVGIAGLPRSVGEAYWWQNEQGRGGWQCWDGENHRRTVYMADPTHWMPLPAPPGTAGNAAGVVVTEAMRREIAITTERLANTPLRDPIWMQKWGEHINALMAANLLPAPKEPTT
jgi:hypothetical protein